MDERVKEMLNNAERRLEGYNQAYGKLCYGRRKLFEALDVLEEEFDFVGFSEEDEPRFWFLGNAVGLWWRKQFIEDWQRYVENENIIRKDRLILSVEMKKTEQG